MPYDCYLKACYQANQQSNQYADRRQRPNMSEK